MQDEPGSTGSRLVRVQVPSGEKEELQGFLVRVGLGQKVELSSGRARCGAFSPPRICRMNVRLSYDISIEEITYAWNVAITCDLGIE